MKTKMRSKPKNLNPAFLMTTAVLATLATSTAYAQGDKTGGGGDILTCIENGAKNYYLLDMYEGKVRGEKISLGSETLSIEEKIALVQSRYSELDSVRAARYAEEALKLAADIKAIEANQEAPNKLVAFHPITLRDIDDADENFSAENCTKAQMVRQEKPLHFNDRHYTFDSRLWSLLSNDQKVATLYHEVIYKELRENGINVSKGARSLNRLLMSGEISKMSELSYVQFLKSLKLNSYFAKGDCLLSMIDLGQDPVKGVTFDSHGKIIAMRCSRSLKNKNFNIELTNITFSDGVEFSAFARGQSHLTIQNDTLVDVDQPDLGLAKFTMIHPNLFRFEFAKVNGGTLVIQTDALGKILSRESETHPYTIGANSKLNQVNAVLGCARNLVQRKKMNTEAELIIQALRQAMPNQSETEFDQILTTCQKMIQGDLLPSVQAVEPVVREIVNGFAQPTIQHCKKSLTTVNAGALFKFGVGYATASCTRSDGSRRFYFGPAVNITVGIGFSIESPRYPEEGRVGKVDHFVDLRLSDEDDLDIYNGDFLVVPGILRSENIDNAAKKRRVAAVGLSVGLGGGSLSTTFRLFRQKDNWNLVVNHLIQNLTYSKK